MSTRKRRLSSEPSPKTTKNLKLATAPVDDHDDGDDSLESILARIKAHEESEALAHKLHQEWNSTSSNSVSPSPSSARAHSVGPSGGTRTELPASAPEDVVIISDGDSVNEPVPEDDEAMARRLAKEWEIEDSPLPARHPMPSTSARHATKGKAKRSVHHSQSIDNDATPAADEHLPAVAKLEQCNDLFTGEKTCPSCGAALPSPRGHVVFSQHPRAPPSLIRLLHAPCKACKANHCRGCMAPVSCPLTCKGEDAECAVETCCTNVRAIALYEALGGFDRQYLGEREVSDQRAREAAAKAQKNQVGSVGPGGTGYGMDSRYGGSGAYSYTRGGGRGGGRGRASASTSNGEPSPLDTLAQHFDEVIVRALNTITGYLPAPYADNPQMYDILPHQTIDALLSVSQLPDLLGNLLRNDSVTDWITRIDVYHAMLGLLRRMADCELTLEVLVGQRWEMSKSSGLEDWMWGEGDITWERNKDTDAYVRAPPLYVHFKKLTRQCEAFLAGASSMLESGGDGDTDVTETTVKATSLCGDIIAARDDIERAMARSSADQSPPGSSSAAEEASGKANSRDKGKARDPGIDLERRYAAECERLAFAYVSLADASGRSYPTFKYGPELMRTANATRNPKDRLHLVKELAVMATSLPPGVWVRVDEVRNDAIKIMIAGPDGTPYAGGLFEFDCFIPLEYPHKPPLMHLRTTGGGSVRFNPNLYNGGKVCLSLLGTWPGRPEEQWSPRSTLLQVLVSIQSMILIDLPYFNEPGYGKANPNNGASIEYNKNICMQTTRWAIVEWFKDEHRNGIWGEIIASHFSTRHDVIRSRIQEWAKTQPNIRKYHSQGIYGGAGFYDAAFVPASLPSAASMADPMDMDMDMDFGMVFGGLEMPPAYPGTSAASANWGGGVPMFPPSSSGHALRSGRKKQSAAAQPAPKTMDLLEEFDTGMKRVREWTFGEGETIDSE
ncbi:hypothetical protein LXA43DRAFT_1127421 [Ganoderma leucocontextum]|nr:hypothetical protein LXA43DRAFT_1127421 [Ganoderma leucocontextum]